MSEVKNKSHIQGQACPFSLLSPKDSQIAGMYFRLIISFERNTMLTWASSETLQDIYEDTVDVSTFTFCFFHVLISKFLARHNKSWLQQLCVEYTSAAVNGYNAVHFTMIMIFDPISQEFEWLWSDEISRFHRFYKNIFSTHWQKWNAKLSSPILHFSHTLKKNLMYGIFY